MKTSYAIQKGITETLAGGIFNRFMQSRIKERRNTLFFVDIAAGYIKECEKAGYEKETYDLGREWFGLIFSKLFTERVRILPWNVVINGILASARKTLGVLDEVHVEKRGKQLVGISANERITDVIGKNMFCPGLVAGVYEVVFGRKTRYVGQKTVAGRYIYYHELLDELPEEYPSRGKEEYDRLNRLEPVKGFTLQDALAKGVFQMKGNRILFRNKGVWQVENTLFHMIGHRGILLERVPEISRKFFAEVLEKGSGGEEKLHLLKTLLQVMGWGLVTIVRRRKSTVVEIRNPPRGFQKAKDDYGFLARTILGFMKNIDSFYELRKVQAKGNTVSMEYLRRGARAAVARGRA